MSFVSMQVDTAGQVFINPRIVKLVSTDSLATITALNYIPQSEQQAFPLISSDIVLASYGSGNTPLHALLTPVFSSSGVTLQPYVQGNISTFNVTVGQAALASAGSVTLVQSYTGQQYQILSLQLNSGGTNFSGGGGDRLGQVTDGTTVYSVIPAASMQTLANAQWGATALPNPASAAINTKTAAGSSLLFKYSGGATDYTAGSLVITGTVLRSV